MDIILEKISDGILHAISESADIVVKQEISESEFLSVMCDESTGISVSGRLDLV